MERRRSINNPGSREGDDEIKIFTVGTGSTGNTYILENNNDSIILDCGISTRDVKKAVSYDITKIKFAICTHIHSDHATYVKKYLNMGIKVFMPKQVKDRYGNYSNAIEIKPMKKYRIDGYVVTAFEVPHDDGVECLAYIIEHDAFGRFLYLTDCAYCRYNLSKLNLSTILCECNYIPEDLFENYELSVRNRVIQTHLNLDTCKEFLRVNKTDELRNVILCHLSMNNSDPEEMVRQVQEVVGDKVKVYVAKKGTVIEL